MYCDIIKHLLATLILNMQYQCLAAIILILRAEWSELMKLQVYQVSNDIFMQSPLTPLLLLSNASNVFRTIATSF